MSPSVLIALLVFCGLTSQGVKLHWHRIPLPTHETPYGLPLQKAVFLNDSEGYISLWAKGTKEVRIYHTLNMGASWDTIRYPADGPEPSAIAAIPHLLLVGRKGALDVSTDEGLSWRRIDIPSIGNPRYLKAISPKEFIVATGSGIFRSSNEGRSWRRTFRPANLIDITHVDLSADGRGLAAVHLKDTSLVYRTGDYGNHWSVSAGGDLSFVCTSSTMWLHDRSTSRDHGVHWHEMPMDYIKQHYLDTNFVYADPPTCVDNAGVIFGRGSRQHWVYSCDRGRTWQESPVVDILGPTIAGAGRRYLYLYSASKLYGISRE